MHVSAQVAVAGGLLVVKMFLTCQAFTAAVCLLFRAPPSSATLRHGEAKVRPCCDAGVLLGICYAFLCDSICHAAHADFCPRLLSQ